MRKDKKSVFAQPECSVIRFCVDDVVSTSGDAPARSSQNEEYETGDTSSWF